MAAIEAVRLFCRASHEYPSSVMALGAYALKDAKLRQQRPNELYVLDELTVEDPAIQAIANAANAAHCFANVERSITPEGVKYVIGKARDRLGLFVRRGLQLEDLDGVLALYPRFHRPGRHSHEDEAAYFYMVMKRFSINFPCTHLRYYHTGKTALQEHRTRYRVRRAKGDTTLSSEDLFTKGDTATEK